MEYIKEAFHLILSGDSEVLSIMETTMVMSVFSTFISSALGLPLGTLLGRSDFKGKGIILRICNTLMSLPPVVAGLIVFMLFRSVGPFGSLHLMFSVPIMVIAQVLLITPVIICLTASAVGDKNKSLCETAKGLCIPRYKQTVLLMHECTAQFVSIILMGFGRSIAEVGAVSLVGGNIQFKTRVMTTAILLETNKGNFKTAVALGILLMLTSLIVNGIAYTIGEKIK